MLKHFVEFVYPGVFFFLSEKITGEEVAERKHELVTIPEGAFGYRFYDQEHTIADDGELLIGERKNYSGFTYFGKIHTLEEFRQCFPRTSSLMEFNDSWIGFVESRSGCWQPFRNCDTVLE